MGKGSQTTSTATSNAADPQAAQAYRDILQRAQGVASTPYQAYSGPLTADVNSQQNLGIAGVNSNANFASPYIQAASGQAAASSSPLTGQQIQNYLNPYTQNVVDTTNAQMTHDNGVAMAGLQGNQISQGALGGNATGVAKAILAGQQGRTMASTDAGLYQQGYGQAVNTAQQQQQLGLAGANAQANYGISGQGAALAGAGQQINAGTLQQQTQQAADTANYGQYAQAQAFPYQQTQWLAGIGTGVGSNLGGTSQGTTTGPAPNQTAQYLGAGLTAAGLFLNRGGAVHRAHGGGVAGYADGGSPMPWGGIGTSWIPTMNIHGGSGAPQGHAPSLPGQPQSSFDPAKVATGIAGLGNKNLSGQVGQFFNPEAYGNGNAVYGGSSGSPLAGLDASDYGVGFAHGGGVAGYAAGGGPQFDDLTNGDPSWENPDIGAGYPRRERRVAGDVINGDPAWEHPDVGPGVAGASFADRFGGMPPAQKNPEFQDAYFSANGADPRAFAGAGDVPTPRARPAGAGTPVVASDDDAEEAPTGVAGRAGGPPGPAVMAFAPNGPSSYGALPDAVTRPKESFGLGLVSPNAKTGLLSAGLGMLASRSPFLGNAIGEGGLAGVSAYGSAEQNDQKVASEAAKLSREARQKFIDNTFKADQQAETSRHNKATEAKEFKPQLIHHPNPATGQEEYGTYDPNTKTIKPLAFPSSGDAKAGERYVSDAAPVAKRRKALPASPEARDEGYMKWLDEHRPPGYADIVRGVTDYEMDPNRVESLQKGQRSQLYRDAKLYDPTYDQTHFGEKTGVINSFSRGADRAAVNSLNVAVSHLGTLKGLGDALNNGNFPMVNRIFNQANIQTGGQAVTNFNAAKEIVGDEVVKAIVGGVSAQADRDAIKHLIMAQQSPKQLQGTIDTFTALLGGQLEGRRTGYQAGTGLNNFDQKYLSPETREALTRVHGGTVDPAVLRMVFPSGLPKPSAAASTGGASPAAIDMLRKSPNLAPQFDQKYGAGASRQYLGQ